MRINPDTTASILSSLNSASRSEREGLLQLASGKKIQSPSDHPVVSALLVRNRSWASANNEYISNCQNLQSMLQSADSVLSAGTSILTRAITLGVQGSTGTQSAENRRALAGEVRGIRDQMISVANTTFRGSYLFAGTASDQPAFSRAADGTVRYEGNEEVNYCRIGENRSIASNVPGDRLFDAGPASIFSALNSLITSLESNDATSIAEATSDIRRSFDNLNRERVFYGNAISRLEANNSQLDAKKLDLEENEERLVGADLAETVSSLSRAQTAIQAILTASGKMSKQSLPDYLQ
jgi:flagellar hook-associated protein 3 FlgL